MQSMTRFQKECAAFFEKLDGESTLVFGGGLCTEPALMLVGEAPGEQEALQGKPFVGRAGRNLEGFLETLGLRREEIYLTNAVKLRPTKISPSGRTVNRPPTKEERALFAPWLMREIAIVKPAALVTLGNVALGAFRRESVGKLHGRWSRAVVSPPDGEAFTLPLFALYHPASVIYNRALEQPYRDDLLKLREALRVKTDGRFDSWDGESRDGKQNTDSQTNV